jgi:hypothetical protein
VFGNKVSFILIVKILLAFKGKTSGGLLNGGETINCLLRFFNFTYSSKTNLISFPLKFVEKFFGKLAVKTGGIVSLAPPVIVPRLAQLANSKIKKIESNLKIDFGIALFFQCTK